MTSERPAEQWRFEARSEIALWEPGRDTGCLQIGSGSGGQAANRSDGLGAPKKLILGTSCKSLKTLKNMFCWSKRTRRSNSLSFLSYRGVRHAHLCRWQNIQLAEIFDTRPNSATRATSQSEFGKPQRDDQIAQRDFSEVILPTGASNTSAVYVQANNASVRSLLQHVTASCGTGSEPLQAALEG